MRVLVASVFFGLASAFPHGEYSRGRGCITQRVKEACGCDLKELCSDSFYGEVSMDSLQCMSENVDKLKSKCVDTLKSDDMVFAKFSCASEVQDKCPELEYDGFDSDDRCLHELYSSGFSEDCQSAFDAAFTTFKEREGLPSEDTPTDKDLHRILVMESKIETEPDFMYEYEDYDLDGIYAVLIICGAVGFLMMILMCVVCCQYKKRQQQAAAARARANANVQYIPMSATPTASPTASAPPTNFIPVAQPYVPRPMIVAMPANQSCSRNGYPGIQ